ncbi:MAG: response regulator [Verrucomicrobiae bacterium]|nr:response regulator [Verrucomicrobiae bacterium]
MEPVLIVDDEPRVVGLIRDALAPTVSALRCTTDAQQAWRWIDTEPFAVVLADHRMPGHTGLELLEHARGVQPEASRILITGLVELSTVLEAINRAELFRFLVKPWLTDELVAAVTAGLTRYRQLREQRAEREELQRQCAHWQRLAREREQRWHELRRVCERLLARLPADERARVWSEITDMTYDQHGHLVAIPFPGREEPTSTA